MIEKREFSKTFLIYVTYFEFSFQPNFSGCTCMKLQLSQTNQKEILELENSNLRNICVLNETQLMKNYC